uniref:NADH-ubiquinone oxidoreductase chain 4L n=1 Tax=Chelydra serpentina TaxID=8475 RepID=A0A8C3TCN3_CHESE
MTPLHFSYYSAFTISIIGLSFHRTHLISTLLCLETFSACEAAIGLSLLVASSRTHGSDHLQNLNLLQC